MKYAVNTITTDAASAKPCKLAINKKGGISKASLMMFNTNFSGAESLACAKVKMACRWCKLNVCSAGILLEEK